LEGVSDDGQVRYDAPAFQSADKYTASVTSQDAGNGGPTGAVDDLALDFYCAPSSSLGAHVPPVSGGFTLLKTIVGGPATATARATSRRLVSAGAVASTLTWTTARNVVSQRILATYGNVAAANRGILPGPLWS
jgi:hypothetical protein